MLNVNPKRSNAKPQGKYQICDLWHDKLKLMCLGPRPLNEGSRCSCWGGDTGVQSPTSDRNALAECP